MHGRAGLGFPSVIIRTNWSDTEKSSVALRKDDKIGTMFCYVSRGKCCPFFFSDRFKGFPDFCPGTGGVD